ncbi:MAG: M28 family peptidase [Promethearchaeota archaeon]
MVLIPLFSVFFIIVYNNKFQNVKIELEFNGNNAYNYVEDQVDIGYRIPGSSDSNKCVSYFISRFKDISNDIIYIIHDFRVHSTNCQNILFKINEDKENIVIIGAHYDSRAKATKDTESSNEPIPGANDGASGAAVMIELANVLYKCKSDLNCQIWFVFFDAEDQGKDEGGYGIKDWDWCEGSKEFVDDIDNFYDSEEQHFECMILLDMVGSKDLQFIYEQYSTSSLLEELFEIGRQLGYLNEFPLFPITSSVIDDHLAFIEDMPTADLIINFWDNPNWPYHHTRKDDISHISKKSLDLTGKTIEQFIYNNYLDELSNNYQGNYPWEEDTNFPNAELAIIFISLAAISVVFPLKYFIRRKP